MTKTFAKVASRESLAQSVDVCGLRVMNVRMFPYGVQKHAIAGASSIAVPGLVNPLYQGSVGVFNFNFGILSKLYPDVVYSKSEDGYDSEIPMFPAHYLLRRFFENKVVGSSETRWSLDKEFNGILTKSDFDRREVDLIKERNPEVFAEEIFRFDEKSGRMFVVLNSGKLEEWEFPADVVSTFWASELIRFSKEYPKKLVEDGLGGKGFSKFSPKASFAHNFYALTGENADVVRKYDENFFSEIRGAIESLPEFKKFEKESLFEFGTVPKSILKEPQRVGAIGLEEGEIITVAINTNKITVFNEH